MDLELIGFIYLEVAETTWMLTFQILQITI